MLKIEEMGSSFNRFITDLREELAEVVGQRIEARLTAEVEQWLRRGYHKRRTKVDGRETGAECQRCGTRQVRHFSRNGHRRQQLVTGYGVVMAWLPRVVCRCGRSVRLPFSVVKPPISGSGTTWRGRLRAGPIGEWRPDRHGRQCPVKAAGDVCVLVALGLYPPGGRWGVLIGYWPTRRVSRPGKRCWNPWKRGDYTASVALSCSFTTVALA